MILAERLCKHYGEDDRRVTALDELDLKIERQERVALLGRSGSGKTTLLNLLAGLDRPSQGKLKIDGQNLHEISSLELSRFRCHKIGILFQSFQLLAHRTALQNVELPLILAGLGKSERIQKARRCLDRVGLTDRIHHRPFELSGGEQQRVAMARAIVNDAPILLADEPTGNLDTNTADQIRRLIMDVTTETKATMVLITHDRELAVCCADRVLQLSDGRLVDADS